MPKFSVVIPVYNAEMYLDRCLHSLLIQNYDDYEIILIDDGSTDKSGQICDLYAKENSNIRVIHGENEGLGIARNKGMRKSRGEYIVFVDNDDYVEENYFEILSESVRKGYDVITFSYNIIGQQDKQRPPVYGCKREGECCILTRKEIEKRLLNTVEYASSDFWFVWRRCYKTEFLLKNNIFYDEKVRVGDDIIFNIKLYTFLNSMLLVNKVIYNYLTDNLTSITRTKYKKNLIQNLEIYYLSRKSIDYKNLPEIKVKRDTAKYYINHILFLFLRNLKNAPYKKLDELKAFRDSIIYKECFKYYTYSFRYIKKSIVVKMFEYRLLKLLYVLLKMNKML
jgi:glycosyltransferase EpsJ